MSIDPADIATMRKQGDLKDYLLSLTGRAPKVQPEPAAEPAEPGYRVAHKGGWPIGSAATGPTPTHGRCTCVKCEKAAVVELPVAAPVSEGEAA